VSELNLALATIGGLVALASIVGGLYAVFKSTAMDKTIERQRNEIGDYIQRLDYVEPRLHTLEQRNETLLALHDPAPERAKNAAEHATIVGLLTDQGRLLGEIEGRLEGRGR
jgi:hypothetical protein